VQRPNEYNNISHIDQTFSEHANSMGGYEEDPSSYQSKELFFRTYYHQFHLGRLAAYETFLRKHLPPPQAIFFQLPAVGLRLNYFSWKKDISFFVPTWIIHPVMMPQNAFFRDFVFNLLIFYLIVQMSSMMHAWR